MSLPSSCIVLRSLIPSAAHERASRRAHPTIRATMTTSRARPGVAAAAVFAAAPSAQPAVSASISCSATRPAVLARASQKPCVLAKRPPSKTAVDGLRGFQPRRSGEATSGEGGGALYRAVDRARGRSVGVCGRWR